MRLVFDIETNGLDDASTIHSLVLHDLDTGETKGFADHPGYLPIHFGLKLLEAADLLVGHNVLTYDVPTLQRLVPSLKLKAEIFDTLIASRLIYTDMTDQDYERMKRKKFEQFPARLIGKHSLKSWGYRLGIMKDDFGETADWQQWSPQMQEYCEQDVAVSVALYKEIESLNYSPIAMKLEHDFQRIIYRQEKHGFRFDEPAAVKLYSSLSKRRDELVAELQSVFEPTVTEMKTPEYYYLPTLPDVGPFKTKKEAAQYLSRGKLKEPISASPPRKKIEPFNPSSRDQCAERLKTRGFKPKSFTDSGKPQIDDESLKSCDIPQAKVLQEYFVVQKRIGQIAEGDKAWLKLAKNGRIHGRMITNGAVTGRCTHMNPNMGQVPKVGSPYGAECRALFTADDGWSLVGADASGLELRCFGHYLSFYDGGDYAKEVVSGDVHTRNQQLAGLPTRNDAKTFIYALLYGAGDERLGEIVKGGKEQGGRLRSKFMRGLPAYEHLSKAVKSRAKSRGHLIGLDGRLLSVRSQHAALNTLLQSAGALIVKKATVMLYEDLESQGLVWGKDFANVAHVHDEVQISVRKGLEQVVGETAVRSFQRAGEFFNFQCPTTGEFKAGRNWAETH